MRRSHPDRPGEQLQHPVRRHLGPAPPRYQFTPEPLPCVHLTLKPPPDDGNLSFWARFWVKIVFLRQRCAQAGTYLFRNGISPFITSVRRTQPASPVEDGGEEAAMPPPPSPAT